MARKFTILTNRQMSRLLPGERVTEHGIEYQRLQDGDGVFRVNIMVDGRRVHRTFGRASDGVTAQLAWEWTNELRVRATQDRLGLSKGRKTEMTFAEAARRYLDELSQNNGKDLAEKRRRLSLHLVPFFGKTHLSKLDTLSIDRYKAQRQGQPSLRGGVRRGEKANARLASNLEKLTSKATINRELAVLSHC